METLLRLAQGCGLKLWELLDFEREPLALAEAQAGYDVKGASQKPKAKTSKAAAAKKASKAKGA